MEKKYRITSLVWQVRDAASVRFHVKSDDYFGTIAAVLSLWKQRLKKDSRQTDAVLIKTLKNIEKDLLFLQKNYQINPRAKNRNKIPNGKLKSQ